MTPFWAPLQLFSMNIRGISVLVAFTGSAVTSRSSDVKIVESVLFLRGQYTSRKDTRGRIINTLRRRVGQVKGL
jgi:hypothetical protein